MTISFTEVGQLKNPFLAFAQNPLVVHRLNLAHQCNFAKLLFAVALFN